MREFIEWYCSEPRLAFNKTVVTRYRIFLEQARYASSTINLRLAAVRRLAYEAADAGLLSSDLAAGIRRVKGAKRFGVRMGNWLACNGANAGRGKLRIMAVEEQDIPYHVMAISELAKNYSAAAFRVEIGHCREVIAKLVAEDNRSDQQRARYRILRYLDLQLARSVGWVDKEADLMAWVMRNLIELKFWAKFVSESGEPNSTDFERDAF